MLSYCLQGVSFVSHGEKVILVHCLDANASDWNLQDSQTLGIPCVFLDHPSCIHLLHPPHHPLPCLQSCGSRVSEVYQFMEFKIVYSSIVAVCH